MTEPLPEQEWQERVDQVGVDRAAWGEVARGVDIEAEPEPDED